MSNSLTIQHLIQYFEEKSRQMDSYNLGMNIGKEPQYPMLVVYLGNDAAKGYAELYSNIFQIWPQYRQEIQFVGVKKTQDDIGYYKWNVNDQSSDTQDISSTELSDLVSSLFGLNNHFRDKTKLLVYYICDTTSMKDSADFEEWMEILQRTKSGLGVDELDLMDMLCVLLNENLSRNKIARQIRNCLCKKENIKCNSTYILSNRRNDNAIIEDWHLCYKIIASIIVLSNNNDVRVLQTLFSKGLYTASYARIEKPSEKIGQVIVNELIDELSVIRSNKNTNLLEEDNISSRLGLTKDGTFHILNDYVEKTLVPFLPSNDELELFPRRSYEEVQPLYTMSAREFSIETMNAWDAYLNTIVEQAQEKVKMDSSMKQLWEKQYENHLHDNFTANELIYLKDHIYEVKEKLDDTAMPSKEAEVLASATANLKYLLSSNEEMIHFFLRIIKEKGIRAGEFLEEWNRLLTSRMNVFSIRDENVAKFYERKVRNYFDYHGVELMAEFRAIQDASKMDQFLERTIDRILDSDPIFVTSFEEELEMRIKEQEAVSMDTKQYIRQKLTGEDVYTYLQINFSYGEPVLSSILLKVGTALYDNLSNNLSPNIYYYDTGCGNCAEALNIYEIHEQDLINDEGR